jgi:hypothetical protein
MDRVLIELGQRALDSVAEAIARDTGFRQALRQIACEFIEWLDAAAQPGTGFAPAPVEPAAGEPPDQRASPAPVTVGTLQSPPRVVRPMTLRIGDEQVTIHAGVDSAQAASTSPPARVGANPSIVEARPSAVFDDAAPDPGVVAARCRLKAEACRLSRERRRRQSAGEEWWDVTESFGRVIVKAKSLPNCYLWPIDPHGPELPPGGPLVDLAGCYEVMAHAVEVLAQCVQDRGLAGWVEPAARLTAEAQSALRAGIKLVALGGPERDQQDTFRWLAGVTREHGLYIDRFMKADDPADPGAWEDLGERVRSLAESIAQRRQSQRQRAQLYGKIRYLVGRLTRDLPDHAAPDWLSLQAAVESLLALKVPPSDAALRENLLPLVESELELPPDYMREGSGMRQVLDQVGRYIESAAADSGEEAEAGEGASESVEVAAAARLLAGRGVVLIGGEPRPAAKAALERAFGLSKLDWVSAPAHSSFWNFEPAIARAETAVVLLMIRWSSHSFGEVRSICERFGKPLVRLPGGYNPVQVAHQVLQQCGGQLAAAARDAAAAGQ